MSPFLRCARIPLSALLCALTSCTAEADFQLDAPDEIAALLTPFVPESPGKRATLQNLLAEILATEGYFSPEFRFDSQGETLYLKIEPGPRTMVKQVSLRFTGALRPEDEARVRAVWALPVGAPFRQADWTLAKQKVVSALLASDYPSASLRNSQADIDAEAASANLEADYDAGPRYRFGPLQIEGLKRYDAALIEHYNREVTPGVLFSQAKLDALQARLLATPYFSGVQVELAQAEGVADEDGVISTPVRLIVRERAPHRFGVGLGSSSNTGHRAELTLHTADLFSRALMLDSGVRVEQKKKTVYADLKLPPDSQGRHHGVGVLYEGSDIQGLRTHRNAVSVQTLKQRGRIEQRLSLNWQNEGRTAEGARPETSRALVPDLLWTIRQLDDLLEPQRGLVLQGQVGGGSKTLLSDQNFVRLYLRWQQYLALGPRTTLMFGSEIGYTWSDSRQRIPQEYLFRAGGAGSLRGYNYQSLGVKEGNAIVGGRYLGIVKTELTQWFGENWGVAGFVDAGNAVDEIKGAQPRLGYGLGGRWRTPAGPIGVDLAYGHHIRKLHLHFSLSIPF